MNWAHNSKVWKASKDFYFRCSLWWLLCDVVKNCTSQTRKKQFFKRMLSVAQVLWIHLIWAMNCLQMFSFVSAINDKLKSWRIFVCTFEPSCYVTLQETKVNSTSQEAREKSFVLFKEISLFASFLTHEIAIFQWNSDRIATALMTDVEISCFFKPIFSSDHASQLVH